MREAKKGNVLDFVFDCPFEDVLSGLFGVVFAAISLGLTV